MYEHRENSYVRTNSGSHIQQSDSNLAGRPSNKAWLITIVGCESASIRTIIYA